MTDLLTIPIAQWPEDARDEWTERASIMQFDGGMTRERAEVEARERVAEKWHRRERTDG